MKLAVCTETRPGETRVAIVPDVAARLAASGIEVAVQAGAGTAARFPDAAYERAGAAVVPDAAAVLAGAAMVARVQPPSPEEVAQLPEGVSVVSFLQPGQVPDVVQALAAKRATVYSLDLLPRISRAQSMDALSSQATVSGYRAGLAGAEHLAKFFPMFMTAAGTVPPAKVLVMGAGVAGLQAIATARRLGAVVRGYDVRAAAKEEVQSLGASFVELGLESQEGTGGYAREQTAEYQAKQQELLVHRGDRFRRGHHHRPDTRPQGSGAGDPGHGRGDGRRGGGGGHGRRLGGQLRVVGARRGRGHRQRGDRGGDDQPTGLDAHPRKLPVLA